MEDQKKTGFITWTGWVNTLPYFPPPFSISLRIIGYIICLGDFTWLEAWMKCSPRYKQFVRTRKVTLTNGFIEVVKSVEKTFLSLLERESVITFFIFYSLPVSSAFLGISQFPHSFFPFIPLSIVLSSLSFPSFFTIYFFMHYVSCPNSCQIETGFTAHKVHLFNNGNKNLKWTHEAIDIHEHI